MGVGGGCPGLPCPIDGAGSSRLFVRFTCFSATREYLVSSFVSIIVFVTFLIDLKTKIIQFVVFR